MRSLPLLFALVSAPAWGSQCRGLRSTDTADAAALTGDTLKVAADGPVRRVRIAGIRAPEETGAQSLAALADVLRRTGNQVRVWQISHPEACGTLLGTVTANDEDVATIMLRDGMALADVRDLPREFEFTKRFYIETERKARDERTGLWRVWPPSGQR